MKALPLLLLLLISMPAFGESIIESPHQVWKVGEQRWTDEEESNFARWVEENITEDFFIRHKIPVDCADVPYAVRWIYARIAGLPAAATTKDNKLIGHWSTVWGHLPIHSEWHKDLRFRKALLHMLSETTTRTLPLDTYPVRIDQESVTSGTMFFVTESHSGVIGRVIFDGSNAHPLQTWEATSPAKIQNLNGRDFLTPRPESTVFSGLVKFRWPIFKNGRWEYLPAAEHPFYSLEQYSSDFYEGYADFVEAVARRIDPTDYDPWEKVERLLHTTTRYLMDRVPVVLTGYQRCQKGGCREGSDLWEVHSTPGRDGRIVLLMDHLNQIVESNQFDREMVRERMEAISIPIQKGQSVTFLHVFQNHLWLSPHPGDSIEARWGLRKCEMILSQIKTTLNTIAFIERTYRKRDLKYADFATNQQQEILRRLNEEWVRSECKEPMPPSPKKKVGK
ncbi:MAG: hypothetical protein FJ106_08375 [Deltaproteobacteria bacterium]|nr:hypothetical protein [Deltaproteobacteria bacterium]